MRHGSILSPAHLSVQELRQNEIIDRLKVFALTPESGTVIGVSPGESQTLRIAYSADSLSYGGVHNLPVLVSLSIRHMPTGHTLRCVWGIMGERALVANVGQSECQMPPCMTLLSFKLPSFALVLAQVSIKEGRQFWLDLKGTTLPPKTPMLYVPTGEIHAPSLNRPRSGIGDGMLTEHEMYISTIVFRCDRKNALALAVRSFEVSMQFKVSSYDETAKFTCRVILGSSDVVDETPK